VVDCCGTIKLTSEVLRENEGFKTTFNCALEDLRLGELASCCDFTNPDLSSHTTMVSVGVFEFASQIRRLREVREILRTDPSGPLVGSVEKLLSLVAE
jgi:hypothetical protein